MNTFNLSQKELLEELRVRMWQASRKLLFGMAFVLIFISILDFVIVPADFLELTILKIAGLAIIIFSQFFLSKVLQKPSVLLHIAQITLTLVFLLSISFTNISGQVLYLVILAITFVSFNAISIWKVSDAIFQFIVLCVLITILNEFELISFKSLMVLGGYTCLAVCAVSTSFPAIKILSLKDYVEKGLTENQQIKIAERKNADLEKKLDDKNRQVEKLKYKHTVFQHDLKNRVAGIESLVGLMSEKQNKAGTGQANYLESLKTELAELLESTQVLGKSFKENNSKDTQPELVKTQVNLHNLIEATNYKLFEASSSKNINLEMHLKADRPIVYLDKNLISIAVFKILKYAIAISETNATIAIHTSMEDTFIALKIVNKQSGISMHRIESDLNQNKFKDNEEDMGFGLSTAKTQIEFMDGQFNYSASASQGFELLVEFKLTNLPN